MAEKALTAVLHEAYVQGVCGRSGMSGISKSQVSRLRGEIDDKVKAFLGRPSRPTGRTCGSTPPV
ncbi:transposase-like protein [Bradyrhizobium sp. USDA 4501]